MKKDLLDIVKSLSDKEDRVVSLFGGCDYIDEEIDALIQIIMEQNGIATENEIVFSNIMEFSWGNLTKKQLLEVFKKYGNAFNK